ncbi:GNAT family N-acetyltransferase [Hirschia litorea]|uniref:GNAT family N-acetyltransferase n=1 Tax=Hirschia litorea TaxID=1199156 RepID=A0ABW2ILJ5_9PROT
MNLENWTERNWPEMPLLEGKFVRLERMAEGKHISDLFKTCATPEEIERAHFLKVDGADTFDGFSDWARKCINDPSQEFYTVIDKDSGVACGRQALMRIDTFNGSIEIGNVHWGNAMARSPKSTEAFFLMADYVFNGLGYRRLEWKCDSLNLPSRSAAERFGMSFEGIFRNHMVRYGKNRDTAWFSLIDNEWPATKKAFEFWLSQDNFDSNGEQKVRLKEFIIRERSHGNSDKVD